MVVMECRPKLNSPRRHDSVFNGKIVTIYVIKSLSYFLNYELCKLNNFFFLHDFQVNFDREKQIDIYICFLIPDSEYSGYSSKQRMFHSPRHSKSHQGTQTDSDLIFSDSAKALNQSTVIREEFYEEQSLLYDRLLKSEEVRNTTFSFIFSVFNKI